MLRAHISSLEECIRYCPYALVIFCEDDYAKESSSLLPYGFFNKLGKAGCAETSGSLMSRAPANLQNNIADPRDRPLKNCTHVQSSVKH